MTRASIGRLGPCAIVLAIAAACGPSQSQTSKASPTPAAPVAPQPRATEAAIGAALDPQLAPIVDGYRKVIVLLESETALDADTRQRAVLVGRLIYQENHQLLSSLTEALTLGGGMVPELHRWGMSMLAAEGCPCSRLMPPGRWPLLLGRPPLGLTAAAVADLHLHTAMMLKELRLPAALAKVVLSAATQDFIDDVKPTDDADWLTLTRAGIPTW